MSEPSAQSVLGVLAKPRLVALGRDVDVAVPPALTKDEQIAVLVRSGRLRFRELLRRLGRDELKSACRAHGLDDSGRARMQLAGRLLIARGDVESAAPSPLFTATQAEGHTPRAGDIVLCRHRQWLVERVTPPQVPQDATVVRLVCLDDDNQGRVLEVLWDLELGARVDRPDSHTLGEVRQVDPPRLFGAYLHAMKWNSVTATDSRLFQAPFRAGIHLYAHQLVPLQKALALPRANLFIADDVGLGKTIEAGLVLSELMLRQRVDLVLIVCPAGVGLQWRDEMQKRFGIHFEVMSRAFVARRRAERGFGVNPWSTHSRFIISHSLLRRPEYQSELLSFLGHRASKSLLIIDEAHVAAPASASKYACDSKLTRVIREVAQCFENRLFLSATPHNGHSNSFSTLLEILDPQRFTRGVDIEGATELEPVMVRRLKEDLRQAGVMQFPHRRVVQLSLCHRDGGWSVTERCWDKDAARYDEQDAIDLGPSDPFELRLWENLTRYIEIAAPRSGRGKLVFINLQKRLLSSVEAFARTLQVHARSLASDSARAEAAAQSVDRPELESADDEYGPDDETLELLAADRVARASAALPQASSEARVLLEAMLGAAERDRHRPDAKVAALVEWIRRHQCPAAKVSGGQSSRPPARPGNRRPAVDTRWSDRRLIIFTEYGDTKRYLKQMLSAAIAGSDDADSRILELHGGMGDEHREEVQRAFNTSPADHPVRILLATDAAREGINLQAFCADLVHIDIPWNPSRMEQRNGRIDRTLQPAAEVFCRYFSYTQRAADPVLAVVVEKVDVIARELGSLGAVVMDDVGHALEKEGLGTGTLATVERLIQPRGRASAEAELEAARPKLQRLRDEVEAASEILERSRKVLELDPVLLREALDAGFELAGAGKFTAMTPTTKPATFRVPELPASWQSTLDTLRPARKRDQSFWEFRQQPPLPVCFEPSPLLDSRTAQLHLQHPVVQRVLGRFVAQGFSMNDLSRVTILRTRRDSLVRVIAFGRLSLFGAGATRLHDEVISVAARWLEGKNEPLRPFAEEGDRNAIRFLEEVLKEAPDLDDISKQVQERVRRAADGLFGQLWKAIRDEADARARSAIDLLKMRGHNEADQLREILRNQRNAIERRLAANRTLKLDFGEDERLQQQQFEADAKHMTRRLAHIDVELDREPVQIENLYSVALRRLSPVGLAVLWPSARG